MAVAESGRKGVRSKSLKKRVRRRPRTVKLRVVEGGARRGDLWDPTHSAPLDSEKRAKQFLGRIPPSSSRLPSTRYGGLNKFFEKRETSFIREQM